MRRIFSFHAEITYLMSVNAWICWNWLEKQRNNFVLTSFGFFHGFGLILEWYIVRANKRSESNENKMKFLIEPSIWLCKGVIDLEQVKIVDRTKDLTTQSGAKVTVHYTAGGESLASKMITILSEHIAKSSNIWRIFHFFV